MNNVIEEVQRLLDDQNVKYRLVKELGKDTFYLNYSDHCGGYTKAICVEGACVTAEISYLLPEEAIALTLGNEPKSMRTFDSMETALAIAEKEVELEKLKRENADLQAALNKETEKLETATLDRPKARSHPYGYEPDTGAFDATRCECGCINDISATYCNDCGGKIEIDMNAEKEIYHTPLHFVYAIKHDDDSLELGGKKYIATMPDSDECEIVYKGNLWWECQSCNEQMRVASDYPNFCPKCGRKAVKR